MTEIILTFPVRRTVPLSCVWFKTGDPAQPLTRKWVAVSKAESVSPPAPAAEPPKYGRCA